MICTVLADGHQSVLHTAKVFTAETLTVFLLVLPSNTIFFSVAWQGPASGTGHLPLIVVLSNTIFLFSL